MNNDPTLQYFHGQEKYRSCLNAYSPLATVLVLPTPVAGIPWSTTSPVTVWKLLCHLRIMSFLRMTMVSGLMCLIRVFTITTLSQTAIIIPLTNAGLAKMQSCVVIGTRMAQFGLAIL